MEQQQVKSVTFESMQTDKAASTTHKAITEVLSAANMQHTAAGSKGGPETSLNAAVCWSPTSSHMCHKQRGSSHKSKHKHSKGSRAADSSSSSDDSDTYNQPMVRKKLGGMKAWRYKLANALGPGTCLRSDLFKAGGQTFQLEVFPAGLSADTPNHLALFLTTPGSVNPNHVLYELAVVDQSGRGHHLLRASKPDRHGPRNSLQTGVVAGYPCFVRAALLQQHQLRYLLNDNLIIRATVEVVRSWSAAPQQLAVPGCLYSPMQKQQLPQQLSLHDAVTAPCYSPHPGYQDRVVTTSQQQQQQAVANQQPQLQPQQAFGSQPCMCPACYIINTAGSNTAAAGSAALAPTTSCTSPPDQHPAQLCECPGCAAAAAATAAAEGLHRQLASPMQQQQQPRGESAAAAGECSCTACSVQKLLQLLSVLVNLQPAIGSEGVAAGSSDQPQQISPADGTAAAAAVVPAATTDASAEENNEEPATSRQPMAAADADAEHKLLSQNAAALTSATCQLAQLLLLQQQQVKHQPSCCTCSENSNRACPATAGGSVCGELGKLVSKLQQQQQHLAGIRPARAFTAAQSHSKLVSSTCSYEVGSPCGCSSMLASNQLPLLQGQQQCITRQCPPVLQHQQHWSPQQQHFLPANPANPWEVRGVVSSPVRLGEAEALQQVDTAGLAVPLVRHHPR